MSKTFVVSDTHNVLKGGDDPKEYEGRTGLRVYERYGAHFAEVHAEYVNKWNSIVSPNDTVIHLGDVIWDTRKLGIFKHLNGKKILVLGNHDRKIAIDRVQDYEEYPYVAPVVIPEIYLHYFVSVSNCHVDKELIFSHMPLCPDVKKFAWYHYKGIDLTPYIGNVHGHFHYEGLTKEFVKNSAGWTPYFTKTGLVYHSVYETPVDVQVIRQRIRDQYYRNKGIQTTKVAKPKKIFSGIFRRNSRKQVITV